jgi:hypothetical protein
MIAGPIITFEDVIQTTTILTWTMAGKMFFIHSSFHVKDHGTNFHLQKWQKK